MLQKLMDGIPQIPSDSSRNNRRWHAILIPFGFTLIELLVVVTIIVVLIAMLIPAMDKAIAAAELAACGSNQKQVVNGCSIYAVQHARQLPGKASNRDGNDPNYAGWGGPPAPAWAKIFEGAISGYTALEGHKVLYCPSMTNTFSLAKSWPGRDANGAATNWQWGYAYFGQYTPNSETSGTWASKLPPPRKMTDRSTTPLVGDVTRGRFKNNPRHQSTPPQWVWIAHSVGSNGSAAGEGATARDEASDFKPRGVNNGVLDGSVTFFRYDTETSGELNYAIQLGGYPGFVWGKTPGSEVK